RNLPRRSTDRKRRFPLKVLNHLKGGLWGDRLWFRRTPAGLACPGYLIRPRSVCSAAWSKPFGAPLVLSQFCPKSVCASSQYFFQNASVMVFGFPHVMQVKLFSSYFGTNTQWPPQLPFRASAPPLCTTSHTS